MNAFSIRDIENLCGIRAHTLRIWEQRYQLVRPKRKSGNHRTYDNEELKYLLRISFLYHRGHKISQLARLDERELGGMILKYAEPGGSHEIFINNLLEASIGFDEEAFDRLQHNIILHMGFEKAVTGVIFPYLEKLGLFWLTGHLVPGQEHFASALVTRKLMVAINGLEIPAVPPPDGRRVLLYTPTGEFHEIPLLYMRYLMKKNGVPTIYFGSNVALEDIRSYCEHQCVTHLYFHLVTNLLQVEPDHYLQRLSDTFPDKDLVISGCLADSLCGTYPRLRILRGLAEMEEFAKGQ
jgi:DNA-binding transcriptional MerR regulator